MPNCAPRKLPPRIRTTGLILGMVLWIIGNWIALAVAVVLGSLVVVWLMDRFHQLAYATTSAEMADRLYVGGLIVSLFCYGLGLWRVADWLGMLMSIQTRPVRKPGAPPRVDEMSGPLGPSPEMIARQERYARERRG